MRALSVAKALFPGAVTVLKQIGRWVLRRILRAGFRRICEYVRERTTMNALRAAGSSSGAARYNRWRNLSRWLDANRWQLRRKSVVRALDALICVHVPVDWITDLR